MIDFNKPLIVGNEKKYLSQVLKNKKLCGDGEFTKKCHDWFNHMMPKSKTLLTTSGTHALEMAALLCDIKSGDEVIMPSYTFVTTANAFVLRGAKIVFVDIRPDTMNIDETLIEAAITDKTRAIVPVHYGGVACEMDEILAIAKKYNLFVIEDAAQALMATYKGQPLGTIGDFGCFSFHETKNYTSGEGGAIVINNDSFIQRAEIIREKGTNRSMFFRGQVDKYTWVDIGSSYLPSEFNAAYLYAQLEKAEEINSNRLASWKFYFNFLEELATVGLIEIPVIPIKCKHNAHMFYIKCKNLKERTALITYLKEIQINTAFHYIPLHSSPAGKKFGIFSGIDFYTSKDSERLLRLPMYFGLSKDDVLSVINGIKEFYKNI